ncbi:MULTISPECIES: DUF3562 domain-containing protein [Cupriavidus]|uniref:DUF3562 domain-containing protein n=1 Tax=Cupriavidus sp. WS TaxID=1312922 RepID=UPI00039F19C8|nr:DUF3562 domain-containing protein [Cupriavidus sp. WS]
MMSVHKLRQPDQKGLVALLAAKAHMPVDDVEQLYEHERAELAVDAHITSFLHIFAIRNVEKILRRRAGEKTALREGGRAPQPAGRDRRAGA